MPEIYNPTGGVSALRGAPADNPPHRIEPTLERPEWIAPPQQWEVTAYNLTRGGEQIATMPAGWEPIGIENGSIVLRRRIA